jgi:predicted RNA-binding Zn ribbon-like protein
MSYIDDMPDSSSSQPCPVFVGDNLALDFINTQFGVGASYRECFVDDASVVAWLKLAQVLPDDFQGAPRGLLKLALELRASAKSMLNAAESDAQAAVEVVNLVLEAGRVAKELEWDSASKSFRVVKQRRHDDAASLLEPVAQAIVGLLTGTQLELVRQCEAHDCTLLFHDLTKSHRRRWCSMAVCGNRMKVAAFRARKKAE